MSSLWADKLTRSATAAPTLRWLVPALAVGMAMAGLVAARGLSAPDRSLQITGVVRTWLAPDGTVPVDLALSNPGSVGLSVTRLTAHLENVSGGQGECSLDDFEIRQYSGRYALTIAAASSPSLGDLGVDAAQWPQLTMVDLPINQDGCKGATIAIGFTAAHRAAT